jgi:hypothetical protein
VGYQRERTQQDSFNPTEDSGIRADSQGQAKDHQQREARTAPHHPEAEAHVLPQQLDGRQPVSFPIGLLDLSDAAEAPQGCRARLRGGHALADVFGGFQLQMEMEFFIQVAFQASSANETGKPAQKHTQPGHDDSPVCLANRARMPDMRCQFLASAASCFLPARVME